MGIQINGQTDTITAVDGGLIVSGADFTGVSAGSTSAPSISPTGDSNTGIFFPSADTISVATGGSQRLRVTSTGRVVVKGPSNPSDYTLSDGIFVQPDNGLSGLTIATGSATNNSYLNFSKGTASNAEQFDFALGRDGTNNRGMVKIADNDVAFFTSNGIAFPNGKGIDFSATSQAAGMTSELLADYEVGTWTPTIYLGGTLQSYSLGSTGESRYTKIGNIVYLQFWMGFGQYGNTNFPTGSSSIFEIGGIPFAFNDNTFSASVGNARTQGGTSSNISIGAGQNSSRIGFWGTSGNYSNWVNQGFLSASSISSNADMILAGTIIYQT